MRITCGERFEAYSPDMVRDLRIALGSSWDVLLTNHSPFASESRREETREALAQRILRCAAAGETNKARLVIYALGSFI